MGSDYLPICEAPIRFRAAALVLLISVIVFSIGFELLRHAIEHAAPIEFLPVVDAMWGALTVIGFVALVMFQFAHTNWWTSVSKKALEDETALLAVAERIHFAVFWTMVAYLLLILMLTLFSRMLRRHWRQLETFATVNARSAVREWQKRPHPDPAMVYRLLRQEFIHPSTLEEEAATAQVPLDNTFDYAEYLFAVLAQFLGRVVRLRLATWLCILPLFFMLFVFTSAKLEYQIALVVLFGTSLAAIALCVRVYLGRILTNLIPPIAEEYGGGERTRAGSSGGGFAGDERRNSEGLEEAILLEDVAPSTSGNGLGPTDERTAEAIFGPYLIRTSGPPPYLTRGAARTALKAQHKLWIFGKRGPSIIFHIIQVLLIFESIYLALFFSYIVDTLPCFGKSTKGLQFCLWVLAVGSPIVLLSLLADCCRLYAMCTSAGRMRHIKAVDIALRRVKLRHSLKTLRMLHLITFNVPPNAKLPAPLSERTVQELARLYSKLDRDGSGLVGTDELGELLGKLGKGVPSDQIQRAVSEIDASGDGSISFAEFCLFVSHHAPVVPFTDRVRAIFDMVDADGSGEVSTEEFWHAMADLDTGLTADDITEMMRELDRDGSGQVNFREFKNFYRDVCGPEDD
eukprot:TRINITY_DN17958_c0_g1_i1.p1 TRINITY_DN17958_c0_g1~~TRINITY_DN17958_c0_g1_i1.p1  ORF type:complete len:629 (-),score=129.57 TRINITY_DN17958_c0_g1_i1:13-1899(-)